MDKPRSNSKEEARSMLFSLQSLSVEDSSNSKILQALYHFRSRPILLDPDNQAINWI